MWDEKHEIYEPLDNWTFITTAVDNLIVVIVQRVKESVGIYTDLNLLPCQTAIIKRRNFNKRYMQIITEYSYRKLDTNMISINIHFNQKVSIQI